MEEHIGRIREELDRSERSATTSSWSDKIHTFWEITRRQLEEKKAELRNKDREMEEAEERHQVEIKVRGWPNPMGVAAQQRSWPGGPGALVMPCFGRSRLFVSFDIGNLAVFFNNKAGVSS